MPHISVTHTLTRVEGDVSGANVVKGRVNLEMLQSLNFPEPSEDTLIFSCGPAALSKATKAFLLEAGYTADMIFP